MIALLLSLWAFSALAAPPRSKDAQRRSEAMAAVQSILSGGEPLAAVARIHYLGQETFAASRLAQSVETADDEPRRRIAQALAELAAPGSLPALVALAQDDDVAVRLYGVRGLGKLKDRRASALLRARLSDKSAGVRAAAAKALGRLGDAGAGPLLIRAAKQEGEPEIRAALLEAVGESGDHRQASALKRFLESSSESARGSAARALCLLGDPAGLAEAKRRLQSGERLDRREGLALLEGVKLKWSRPLLQPLLEGRDRPLAAAAARMLYQGGEGEMLVWLVKAAHNAKPEDRAAIESELERLDLSDDQRSAILKEAGLR